MYIGIPFLNPIFFNFQKKCQRYWPLAEENEMLVDIFSIQLFSEKTYANFEVHHLKVTNKKRNVMIDIKYVYI